MARIHHTLFLFPINLSADLLTGEEIAKLSNMPLTQNMCLGYHQYVKYLTASQQAKNHPLCAKQSRWFFAFVTTNALLQWNYPSNTELLFPHNPDSLVQDIESCCAYWQRQCSQCIHFRRSFFYEYSFLLHLFSEKFCIIAKNDTVHAAEDSRLNVRCYVINKKALLRNKLKRLK